MAGLAEKPRTSQSKGTQSATSYQHDEHSKIHADEDREPIRDIEKNSSDISGDGLNKVPTEDPDNVVTPKAWLVVVVRSPSCKNTYKHLLI